VTAVIEARGLRRVSAFFLPGLGFLGPTRIGVSSRHTT
jgi:hypothetical protein